MTDKLKKLEALEAIVTAMKVEHGEIFLESYARHTDDDFVASGTTGFESGWFEGLRGEKSQTFIAIVRKALKEPSFENWIKVWKAYFTYYPSHGEYAGAVASTLMGMGKYDEVVEILGICGKGGWDS